MVQRKSNTSRQASIRLNMNHSNWANEEGVPGVLGLPGPERTGGLTFADRSTEYRGFAPDLAEPALRIHAVISASVRASQEHLAIRIQ